MLISATCARAVDVEGVLPASLDQPRIFLAIARDANSPPLTVKGDANGLADLLADAAGEKHKNKGDDAPSSTFAIEAFLDTGASGVTLSKQTSEGLGIVGISAPGTKTPVKFFDVGIGGEEPFDVSPPLIIKTCDYGGNIDGEGIDRYAPLADAKPVQISLRGDAGMMEALTGGTDIAGMPVMMGRVVVVDAKPLKDFDKLKTTIVAPGDRSIPTPDVVVPLTYVDFSRFCRFEPVGVTRGTLRPNPMIGPDPFDPADRAAPIVITHGTKRASLTMLLDTGATSSFISIAKARELGINVDANGRLINVPETKQFTLPIGGIGAAKEVHGFYVDTLTLPHSRGDPVRYVHAPVMVMDVTVTDATTKASYTLDGAFGINYLVASADITTGGLLGADLGDMHEGAFDAFTIDHVNKTLGLKLKR